MPIDINKHEVEIDNLFKQNELDLCSIKELYRKLKELEKKILQIKYIDSNLADKLKKDYEKLKRIILDENIQVQLNNKIDETKTTLINNINELNSQVDNIIKATVTEELVVLENNFTATYNRIVKDRNGDFAVLELQTKYSGTLEGGVDIKICSLPNGAEAYTQKQILCSISTNQWTRDSICYGFLTNDSISVKLPNTMTNPYIVVDIVYRLRNHKILTVPSDNYSKNL